MTSPERPRAYTVDAAAAEAGVSRRTMYRLITDGQVATVRVRGRQLVTEESLTAYIKSREAEYEIVDKPEGNTPCPSQ